MNIPEGLKKLKVANKYGGIGVHISYEGVKLLTDMIEEMAEALEKVSYDAHDHGSGVTCPGCIGNETLKKFKEWK